MSSSGTQGTVRYATMWDTKPAQDSLNQFKNVVMSTNALIKTLDQTFKTAQTDMTGFTSKTQATNAPLQALNKNITTAEKGMTALNTPTQSATKSMQQMTTQEQSLTKEMNKTAQGAKEMGTQTDKISKGSASLGSRIKDTTSKFSGFATGISATTTSVLQLGAGFRDYSDSQIAVDKATRKVSLSHEALGKAQDKLNSLTAKGITSGKDYQQAQLDVKQAQDKLKIDTDLLGEAQERMFDSQSQFVASIIPAVTGGIGTLGSAFKELTGDKGIGGLTKAFSSLKGSASSFLSSASNVIGTSKTGLLGIAGASSIALAGAIDLFDFLGKGAEIKEQNELIMSGRATISDLENQLQDLKALKSRWDVTLENWFWSGGIGKMIKPETTASVAGEIIKSLEGEIKRTDASKTIGEALNSILADPSIAASAKPGIQKQIEMIQLMLNNESNWKAGYGATADQVAANTEAAIQVALDKVGASVKSGRIKQGLTELATATGEGLTGAMRDEFLKINKGAEFAGVAPMTRLFMIDPKPIGAGIDWMGNAYKKVMAEITKSGQPLKQVKNEWITLPPSISGVTGETAKYADQLFFASKGTSQLTGETAKYATKIQQTAAQEADLTDVYAEQQKAVEDRTRKWNEDTKAMEENTFVLKNQKDALTSEHDALLKDAVAAGATAEQIKGLIDIRTKEPPEIEAVNQKLRELIIVRKEDVSWITKSKDVLKLQTQGRMEGAQAGQDFLTSTIKNAKATEEEEFVIRKAANALGLDYNTAMKDSIENIKDFITFHFDAVKSFQAMADAAKEFGQKAFDVIGNAEKWKDAEKNIKKFLKSLDFSKAGEKAIKLELKTEFKAKQEIDKAQQDLTGLFLEVKANVDTKTFNKDVDATIGHLQKALGKGADVQPFIDLLNNIKSAQNPTQAFVGAIEQLTGLTAQDVLTNPQKLIDAFKNANPQLVQQYADNLKNVGDNAQNTEQPLDAAQQALVKYGKEASAQVEIAAQMSASIVTSVEQMAGNVLKDFGDMATGSSDAIAQMVKEIKPQVTTMNTYFAKTIPNAVSVSAKSIQKLTKEAPGAMADMVKGVKPHVTTMNTYFAKTIKGAVDAAAQSLKNYKKALDDIPDKVTKELVIKITQQGKLPSGGGGGGGSNQPQFVKAQHGMHGTLERDTIIEAHRGERVDIESQTKSGAYLSRSIKGIGTRAEGFAGDITVNLINRLDDKEIFRSFKKKLGNNMYAFGA